ncbi:hypothetical protein CEQ51_02215 [Pseudomonas thivervalensis]|uniref:Uncharacterized protein n=1 Tax=Pseudomonas thivervalensis TaxID=86265 RepID=A0A2Z4ZLE6_9PSED|nr:hypothetical protein CE140_02900 [Pseudomonas thivervalensis]AXA58934.1 hypothetical protein CEQ51_02215 [Pseudomonas thivervalensis]
MVEFFRSLTYPCGSELARDSGGSACINVECADAIASRLAPTMGGVGIGIRLDTAPCGEGASSLATGGWRYRRVEEGTH